MIFQFLKIYSMCGQTFKVPYLSFSLVGLIYSFTYIVKDIHTHHLVA